MAKGLTTATIAALRSKWMQNVSSAAASVARKAKYLAHDASPMTVPEGLLDSFQKTSKSGRTVQEQIQYLQTNWVSKQVSGKCQGNKFLEKFNGELYTHQGSNNRWIKIDDELYFIREESGSNLHNLFDDMYSSIGVQNLKPSKSGHLGYGGNPEDNLKLYKYIEADAQIIDNPSLINEGFGLDCLLSTPITNKSVIVKNGKAIRTQNGLIDYFGEAGADRIAEPRKMIMGDVNISSYFAPSTDSSEILRNMSEKELLNSLRKLEKIDEKLITNLYGNSRIKEQLLIRKDNLKKFTDLMEQYPKKANESMYEYTQRIEAMIPKQKQITAPIDDFVLKTEPDTVLKPIEENWQSFQQISKKSFNNNSTEKLADGTFIHNAPLEYFESTVENGGLFCGQVTHCKTGQGSTVSGNWTTTPGQLDTFIVKGEQSIPDYFNISNRHKYENDFMQYDNKINYIINKDRVSQFNKAYLPRPDQKGLETHYTIPFGVPINTVDRIVVSPNLTKSEVDNMITVLKRKNLDIKIYDKNGNLLYDASKTTTKSVLSGAFFARGNGAEDKLLSQYRFDLWGKKGLPLEYPRQEFVEDIEKVLKEVPENERQGFLKKFGLDRSYADIDGIPTIKNFKVTSPQEQKMVTLIEKFYNNQVKVENAAAKPIFDSVLEEFPEFGMVVGKLQHRTHAYSVDIHSLKVLQKAIRHPSYGTLSDEWRQVLKLTALMHDFGKMGGVITPEHAMTSRVYAERILTEHGISQNIKERVLNQIEHHHWFEAYNTGRMNAREFGRTFKTEEDRQIAIMLAKGDFESVNSTFHLDRLKSGQSLSAEEYDATFDAMMKNLLSLF